MKKKSLVFLFFVIAVSFISAQSRTEIINNGTRYLFKDGDERIHPYMILEYQNKSMILMIQKVDFKVGVIQLMIFNTFYDNDSLYIIPDWWMSDGKERSISKVRDDIYTINWGETYLTKIKAEGAWATAVLDIYN